MLTFLSPLLLVGLASAAIPLLIHLSRSRRAKTLRFSTTRFFTDQFLRTYRMSRINEWLVLLARMAVCGLLATALARPLWTPSGRPASPGGSRAVALVLDDSASMGYSVDGTTLLSRAKLAARDVLASLRPGDTATIVLAGRNPTGPRVLFTPPTTSIADALAAVEGVKVATLSTDLASAVAKARTLIAASPAPSKEVVVLSDLQESGWTAKDETSTPPSADVTVLLARLHPDRPANVGITAIQLASARPMVGVPFAIRPLLNVRGDAIGPTTIRLVVDGQTVAERSAERGGDGRWVLPRFHHTFPSSGWHSGHVEVGDDALPGDNRRYFAVEVLASLPLLAVNGAPSQAASRDELFFLRAALTASDNASGPFRLDSIAPDGLATKDLSAYPLVILANVASLPTRAIEALETYVDRGGRLLIFPGDKLAAAAFSQTFASSARLHGGLSPAKITRRIGNPIAPEAPISLARFDTDHPALAPFADERSGGFGSLTLKTVWKLDPGSSRVLMQSNLNSALLCEKAFGKGRVMLAAFPIDRDWSDFPVTPAFLPWVHRVVGNLAQASSERSGFFATGDLIPLPVSAAEGPTPVVVKRPDGTLAPAEAGDDPTHPLVFSDTARPGVYAVLDPKRPERPTLLSVNLDGRESDLTYLDDQFAEEGEGTRTARIESGLRALLPGRPRVAYLDDPAKLGEAALDARRGVPLWDIALWLALTVAILEPWLANRISILRHGGRRTPAEISLPSLLRSSRPAPEEVASR